MNPNQPSMEVIRAIEFFTTEAGYPAAIFAHGMGHLCGYVKVPDDHPLHGCNYGDEAACLAGEGPAAPSTPDVYFDLNSVLTFSSASLPSKESATAGWWFGFHCAHYGDSNDPCHPAYRSPEYVRSECESLAAQLAEIHPSS